MPVIDEFVARARAGRLTTSKPVTWNFPPADGLSVIVAEHALGFPLPPLLRELYLKVGNGGFGPGYGLFGLEGGAYLPAAPDKQYLVDVYRYFVKQPHAGAPWQDRLLPICHWRRCCFSCLDCALPQAPVLSIDLNAKGHGPLGCDFALHAHSFEELMRRFLDGEDLWDSFGLSGEPRPDFEPDEPD